jgi:hypothetical protein
MWENPLHTLNSSFNTLFQFSPITFGIFPIFSRDEEKKFCEKILIFSSPHKNIIISSHLSFGQFKRIGEYFREKSFSYVLAKVEIESFHASEVLISDRIDVSWKTKEGEFFHPTKRESI